MAEQPFLAAILDRSDRGEVKTAIDTVKRIPDGFLLRHIGPDQFDAGGWQILRSPAEEIIQNPDPMTVCDQRLCQVRADKTGSAGNQIACHCSETAPSFTQRSREERCYEFGRSRSGVLIISAKDLMLSVKELILSTGWHAALHWSWISSRRLHPPRRRRLATSGGPRRRQQSD